ncbi:hypothetical protein E2C01_078318 [Portunus trituberculatus]|uniref:Uncharacterized protein n=1 Tax=Portunus trituberculatus TaxID=210409 RepID=A0A5B7IPT8_PORTR|nr:hypothetical protein [Portunus trituberculatus]
MCSVCGTGSCPWREALP